MTKCFAFAIGGMSDPFMHPIQAKKVKDFLKELDGLLGIHLFDRYHTFLVFDTLNNAKVARNRFRAEGNQTGSNIMNAELSDDKQTLNIIDKAD